MSATIPPERRSTDCRTSSLPGDLRQKQHLRSCHRPWNSISVEEMKSKSSQDKAQMCSELWDLKVRLLKRGIVFGDAHQRLSDGSTSRHTLRLCHDYDDLRQRWLKKVESRYSICSTNNTPANIPRRPSDDDHGLSDGGDSTPRDGDVDRPSFDVTSRIREARKTGVPQNIGWRFSDDLEPVFRSISWHLHHKSESIARPHELKKPAMSSKVQVLEGYLEREEEVVNKENEKPEPTRPSSKRLSIYPASFGAFQLELLTVVTLPSAPKRSSASAAIPSPRPRRPELRINTNVQPVAMCERVDIEPRRASHQMPNTTTGVIMPFTEFSIVDQIPLEKQRSRKKSLRKWVKQTFRRR